ncbi:MAG: alpha/beta fold hydrolase [Pseudomonadota bacterium]
MSGFDWASGSGWITAGGKRLEAKAIGPAPGAAPTIVMLHEGLGSVGLWRDFPEALAKATGCGVFLWSRAGYGASEPGDLPRPTDYQTREAMDVLPDVLGEIGFQEGVLLGHSDGATIAAEYAGGVVDHRVRGLILMAPHFFVEEIGVAAIRSAKTAFKEGDLRARLAKHHSDPDNAFRGWNDAWLHPDFADWNVADCIDYFRIPTLAIQGRDDAYGTLAQIEEIDARSYAPVDLEVIADCGHAPHLEAPDATLAAMAEFIARLRRIESTHVSVA